MLVRENDSGLVLAGLGEVNESVGKYDNHVAHSHLACCGAIEADGARATLAPDGVGFEALAVVDVYDGHFLVFDHVGRIEQIFVDGDAAHIVQLGLRDFNAMNLRLKNFDVHKS